VGGWEWGRVYNSRGTLRGLLSTGRARIWSVRLEMNGSDGSLVISGNGCAHRGSYPGWWGGKQASAWTRGVRRMVETRWCMCAVGYRDSGQWCGFWRAEPNLGRRGRGAVGRSWPSDRSRDVIGVKSFRATNLTCIEFVSRNVYTVYICV
jgi:hypothetical protein